jgi:hypothetical protein
MFRHFTLRFCGFPFVEIKDVSPSSSSQPSDLGDAAITKSNKQKLSLNLTKPNKKSGCTLATS